MRTDSPVMDIETYRLLYRPRENRPYTAWFFLSVTILYSFKPFLFVWEAGRTLMSTSDIQLGKGANSWRQVEKKKKKKVEKKKSR